MSTLKDILPKQQFSVAKRRYNQASTTFHLLAFLLDPRYQSVDQFYRLSQEEEEAAFKLAADYQPLLPVLIKLKSKCHPFDKPYLFEKSVV